MKNAISYIDGFNLYHSIKDLKCYEYLKWQNLAILPKRFLSKNDNLLSVNFFTAYPTWKQDSYARHRVYVRILQDLGINVVFGNFKIKDVFCDKCKQKIKKHEEKQTDVNIATQILRDIYEKKPDIIQIISGDTDLIPPIKVAKEKGINIQVVIPMGRRANEFDSIVDKKSKIKLEHLIKCFIGKEYTTRDDVVFKCPYNTP